LATLITDLRFVKEVILLLPEHVILGFGHPEEELKVVVLTTL
jgi:hypothetical protein